MKIEYYHKTSSFSNRILHELLFLSKPINAIVAIYYNPFGLAFYFQVCRIGRLFDFYLDNTRFTNYRNR